MRPPSRASRAVEPELHRRLDSSQHLSLFAGRMIIAAGTLDRETRLSGDGPMRKGLKVVVVLSGKERIKVEGHPVVDMDGPQACVILNEHDDNNVHWLASTVPLRFALVQLDPDLVDEEFGVDLVAELRKSRRSRRPVMHIHSAGDGLQALASQIVACPIRGAMRRMYLAGKGLELVASALNPVLHGEDETDTRLTPADLKRVHAAYDRLVSAPRDPPSLAQLGQEVGLNTTKLTMGFRRAYGTTVFGILQEHRLQQAYRMLSSGQVSVSEAAYRVGYAPAHFATIFRRRFGVSPSKLVPTS